MKFDVVVGNIPFTINNNDIYTNGSSPKKVANEFIKLISNLTKNGKSVYILPAKYDSKIFIDNLIHHPDLQKITHHRKKIFNIADSIHTCHVLLDSSSPSVNFEYTFNDTHEKINLPKNKNLTLGRSFETTYLLDNSKLSLGDIWTLSGKYRNQITNTGTNKVITAVGKYNVDEFDWSYDETETNTLGQWKVILPKNGGGRAIKIAGPDFALSMSIIGLIVEDELTAVRLKKWMIDTDVLNQLNKIRTSFVNSKTSLSKIILPDGII